MNGYNFYASTPDYSIKEYIYVNYIRDYLVAIVLTIFSVVWLYRKVNFQMCVVTIFLFSYPTGSAQGVSFQPSRSFSS